jgi:putative Holliday junction resolvase
MGRVVALDIGERRIGVAVSDPSGIVVRSAGVVKAEPRARALAEVQRIVREEEAMLVVVGLPLTLRGEHGPQAQRVMAFVEALRTAVPIPLVLVDERFTSSEAERIIRERGSKRDKRRREAVDELAAKLILEDYLQEQRLKNREQRTENRE